MNVITWLTRLKNYVRVTKITNIHFEIKYIFGTESI